MSFGSSDRPEQLHSSVVHMPLLDILPAEDAEEAPLNTAAIPIIDTGMSTVSVPYKPPARRPHRIIPAGPPISAVTHHANVTYERMTYSYHWTERLGMVVTTFAAAAGLAAAYLGWMFLNG